ncbi:MAG: tetratricopeptide repeat protein, partial [Actinomycetales bacterium]
QEPRGDWSGAETSYTRSLQVSEDLAERFGGPQELRDLSISLDNVGRVQAARGDWTGAETSYTRSLQVREHLAERVGGPQELRDLSISVANVGRVQEARGDWTGAETSYRRALDVAERLVDEVVGGSSPEEFRQLRSRLEGIAARLAELKVDDARARALALARRIDVDTPLKNGASSGEVPVDP